MDGGIIDYGSIRQFGLFHAEYRYDDVQRYSTTILEQRQKAKYMVQCFVQIADFLSTKKKKSLSRFKKHPIMQAFDKNFVDSKNRNLLLKIGFKKTHVEHLLKNHLDQVTKFRKVFSYFERAKSKRGAYKVPDGVNRDALFCMRDILRELPQLYLARSTSLSCAEFTEIIKSSYARKSDLRLTDIRKKQINRFQSHYLGLIATLEKDLSVTRAQQLLELTMRASVINKYDRVTGDSITYIVQKVQKLRPKLAGHELFELSQQFATYQNLNPDQKIVAHETPERHKNIMQNFHSIVRECREGL
jgi:hypothetical protein